MKPVQLTPAAKVKAKAPGSGSLAGAIIAGGVLVLAVSGYFLFAHVNDLKTETATITASATAKEAEVQAAAQELAEAGKKRDWSLTASGYKQELIAKLGERVDYSEIAREVSGIMVGTGGWLTGITATSGASNGAGDVGVSLTGYAPNVKIIAALAARIDATASMEEANIGVIEYVDDAANRKFIKFTIHAKLTDAPDASDAQVDPVTGQVVAATPEKTDETPSDVSVEPRPGYNRRAKKAAKAAPKPQLSNLEKVAAAASGYGGGK